MHHERNNKVPNCKNWGYYRNGQSFETKNLDTGNFTIEYEPSSNARMHYLPKIPKKRGRGRPPVKGEKLNWSDLDEEKMPLVYEDAKKRVRTGEVWVKCLGKVVRLVAVEYLNEKDKMTSLKLYFCTDRVKDWQWVLTRYGIRVQIEFNFRDSKQYLELMHCQSRNETKLTNHVNLTLTTRNLAYVAHKSEGENEAFSMAEIVE